MQQRRHEPSHRNDEVANVAVSDIEAKREHIARKAKRDRAAFEGDFAQLCSCFLLCLHAWYNKPVHKQHLVACTHTQSKIC